jgi:hypothetical protein
MPIKDCNDVQVYLDVFARKDVAMDAFLVSTTV